MLYLLIFHFNNGYANDPQFYVIRTVLVLFPNCLSSNQYPSRMLNLYNTEQCVFQNDLEQVLLCDLEANTFPVDIPTEAHIPLLFIAATL